MNHINHVLIAIVLLFLFSCSPKTAVVETEKEEVRELETIEVTAPAEVEEKEEEKDYTLPIYRAAATRTADLLHTRLDLSFDWEKQHALGEAYIDFTPVFYDLDTLILDAVNFDIHSVKLKDNSGKTLDYLYDGSKLKIVLDKTLKRDQEQRVYIDYTAKPEEGDSEGSAAITSAKGLYFINPTGDESVKPRQIWTQGETESNSRWFPTFDKPNERVTQEMYITVEDKYETLSNGTLVSSTKNADGTRTDYYKMDKPHAPYLFMMAIGDFAVVKENWKNIPLEYYVEHEYEDDAKEIFAHTPEMLTFFSDLVGYEYPWSKYSQVVVRDYVSGAMENTTGVIFGEFVQKHKDELLTSNNDDIVAHEMFHHWFGDLVTTENWANLTLNEGFANYSEYLWREHDSGKDHAERHRQNQLRGYLQQAGFAPHPLIHYEYKDKEDMFDAHSYNKGGLVLHMLRNYIGDEAFFAGLNKYLKDNQYSAVEVDELRLAFEDITGRDLQWFFNQWFLEAGHPNLVLSKDYDAERQHVIINVEQTQDPEKMVPIFQIPMEVKLFYANGNSETRTLDINQRSQTFHLAVDQQPELVLYDPQYVTLATIEDDYSNDDIVKILKYADNYRYVTRALSDVQLMTYNDEINQLIENKLKAPYYNIRIKAMEALNYDDNVEKIRNLAQNDDHILVRTNALNYLHSNGDEKAKMIADQMYENGESLKEKMVALNVINKNNPVRGLEIAEQYMDSKSMMASSMVTNILSSTGDKKYLPYFEKKIKTNSGFANFSDVTNYTLLVNEQDFETKQKSVQYLADFVNDKGTDLYSIFSGVKGLSDIRSNLKEDEKELESKINVAIKKAYDSQEEGQLKRMLSGFVRE